MTDYYPDTPFTRNDLLELPMISVFQKYHRHLAIVVYLSLSTAVVTAISFALVNQCFQYFSASPMNLEDHPIPHSRFRIGRRSLN